MISSPSPPPLPPAPGPPPNPPMYGSGFQTAAGQRLNASNPGTSGFGGTILGQSNPGNVGQPGLTSGAIGALAGPQQATLSNQKTLLGQ